MLERCPKCRYSLRGLPTNHRCPECGLEYDKESAVFRHIRPYEFLVLVGCNAVLLWIITKQWILDSDDDSLAWRIVYGAMAVALIGVIAFQALRFVRIYRRGPAVLILPEGLQVRLDEEYDVTWDEIEDIGEGKKPRTVRLKLRSERLAATIQDVFDNDEDVERFIAQVRRRMSAKGR